MTTRLAAPRNFIIANSNSVTVNNLANGSSNGSTNNGNSNNSNNCIEILKVTQDIKNEELLQSSPHAEYEYIDADEAVVTASHLENVIMQVMLCRIGKF